MHQFSLSDIHKSIDQGRSGMNAGHAGANVSFASKNVKMSVAAEASVN